MANFPIKSSDWIYFKCLANSLLKVLLDYAGSRPSIHNFIN